MVHEKQKAIAEANANFHRVAGGAPFDLTDARQKEYRSYWKSWPESFHVGDFPLFLDIEVTSVCNLRCPFCAATYNSEDITKGYIEPELVKRIIDEGAENNLYGVKFNYRGEPLLHPQITDFVKYAKNKGLVDVYFNTNGLRLNDKVADELIEAGMDRISVSFEGFTKEVYETHRVGSNFEKVLRNIKNLKERKARLNVRHPHIRVQTVLLPELLDKLDAYREFWIEYADEVAYLDYKDMKERQKGVEYAWACPQIWQRMQVWWDGTITPCNHDDDADLSPGNANQMSIRDAWHSGSVNRVRQAHTEGQSHVIAGCDGCYLRDSEIRKLRLASDQ